MRLATVSCIPTLLALPHIQNTLQTPSTCLKSLKVKLQEANWVPEGLKETWSCSQGISRPAYSRLDKAQYSEISSTTQHSRMYSPTSAQSWPPQYWWVQCKKTENSQGPGGSPCSVVHGAIFISKKSLNFENSRVLQSAPEFSRVLKVQRFFADVFIR